MATQKKSPPTGLVPRINLSHPAKRSKSNASPLFMQRMRELDREFARQTKQLTAVTKQFQARVKKKLTNR